jgi:hypothetical protein
VGIDHAFWDFNEANIGDEDPSRLPTEGKAGRRAGKRVEKLRTLGGASFFSLSLCYVTGFPVGRLGKPGEVSTEILKEFIDIYKTAGRPIETIVADVGIVNESMFRVFNTNVIKLLIESGIKYQKVMPYDHSIGGNKIEVCVRYIKEKMRLAYNYVMANPNIFKIGFEEMDIKRLWGEVFNWALFAYSLGPSYRDKTKSKFEDFLGYVPNIQELRLFPIFAVLLVRTGDMYDHGLYVGPHWTGPHMAPTAGAIRVAIKKESGAVVIITTQNYKCVTEGYNVDLNPRLDRGFIEIMREVKKQMDQEEAPSSEPIVVRGTRSSRRQQGLPIEAVQHQLPDLQETDVTERHWPPAGQDADVGGGQSGSVSEENLDADGGGAYSAKDQG